MGPKKSAPTARVKSAQSAQSAQSAKPAKSAAKNRRKPRPEPKPPLSVRLALSLSRIGLDPVGRERVQALLTRGALVITAVALLVGGVGLVERHLKTSKSFAIENVEITGNEHLTQAQVLRAARLSVGQNVFEVSPEQARKNLLSHPWVESAAVRRRLPGRFTIELHERRPVALMASGQLFLVSDVGQAFKPLEPGDPSDFPIISGLDPNLRGQDETALSTALVRAVALMDAYSDVGLARREPISEIHVDSDGGLSLYVGSDAMYVRLGPPPFRPKLEKLREVLTRLSKDKARAAYVYLDNQRRQDRVTARLR